MLKNIENSKLDKSKYLRALALNGEIKNIDFTYLDNLIMEINRIGINIQKV
ncbi:plasmid mobilization protein (plasmid) [Clostridium perfringens]|uniref:plasmid mobilization protein n=1 Tax=Clostridium perfringens TaxID=1502 RepID=UPI003A2539D9